MRTRRRGGAPLQATRKELRQLFGDESDESEALTDSEPAERVDIVFTEYISDALSRLDTASHIPPIFAPLIRRFSNVEVMCLATGRFHGRDRNILFIGEFHGEHFRRKHGFTPISEIIVPYLRDANYVDFMLETSVDEVDVFRSKINYADQHDYQRQLEQPKNTTGVDIMNQLRKLLFWYIPTEGHPATKAFPKAKVHYIDLAFPAGHKKSTTLLTLLTDLVQLDRNSRKGPGQSAKLIKEIQAHLIELSQDAEPLTPNVFREAFDMTTSFEDRVYALLLIFDCAFEELRRVVLANCYGQARNIDTLHYSSIFMTLCERFNYDDYMFFYDLNRFLMDIYTCCRILKSDASERWYKNMVVYAGAFHTINCIRLMKLYGFTVKTVDFMNADLDQHAAPVPPFISGAIHAGRFYSEGEAQPSSALKGYLDSAGRFFEGATPGYYEID